jgi:hypothetical protein
LEREEGRLGLLPDFKLSKKALAKCEVGNNADRERRPNPTKSHVTRDALHVTWQFSKIKSIICGERKRRARVEVEDARTIRHDCAHTREEKKKRLAS